MPSSSAPARAYGGVRRLLRRAELGDDAVDRAVERLHRGQAVVLVDSTEVAVRDAWAHPEQAARAA